MCSAPWRPDDWLRKHRLAGHRALLVLEGDRQGAISLAGNLVERIGARDTLWITDLDGITGSVLSSPIPAQLIGMELDAVVVDSWAGLDVDVLGAVGGAVRGGGLMVLCVPMLDRWAEFDDPSRRRFSMYPGSADDVTARFVRRLAGMLAGDSRARVADPSSVSLPAAVSMKGAGPRKFALTQEQRDAVEGVCHVVAGQRRRPAVVTADRGRGKSAAMGVAAATLLQRGAQRVVVTAVRRAAVEVLFRHAEMTLRGESSREGRVPTRLEWCGAMIEFANPWELLEAEHCPDIVLVDEAAALPLGWHDKALNRFGRIAFATTVHGYEGSGRGFAMRFRDLLDRHTRGWREIRLSQPVRWRDKDPLEGLLFDALLLNADVADIDPGGQPDSAPVCERLDRESLVGDEATLRAFFGMLVQSHYRTRPNDLRYLLDAPNLELYAAREEEAVVAAAVVACEGGFDSPTVDRIWQGISRPRGHMLAETLSAQLGEREAPLLKGRRVVRIAVHPARRRLGIGSGLLQRIVEDARAENADYVGSSFAMGVDVAAFWLSAGFQPTWLGGKRASSSGARSLVMLHPLSSRAYDMASCARTRFLENFSLRLSSIYADEDPSSAAILFAGASNLAVLEARDVEEVERFASGAANFESCFTGIWRAARVLLARPWSTEGFPEEERRLLVFCVLQQHPLAGWVAGSSKAGRRGAIDSLRFVFLGAIARGELPARR